MTRKREIKGTLPLAKGEDVRAKYYSDANPNGGGLAPPEWRREKFRNGDVVWQRKRRKQLKIA
jgi:hypothetical protein